MSPVQSKITYAAPASQINVGKINYATPAVNNYQQVQYGYQQPIAAAYVQQQSPIFAYVPQQQHHNQGVLTHTQAIPISYAQQNHQQQQQQQTGQHHQIQAYQLVYPNIQSTAAPRPAGQHYTNVHDGNIYQQPQQPHGQFQYHYQPPQPLHTHSYQPQQYQPQQYQQQQTQQPYGNILSIAF